WSSDVCSSDLPWSRAGEAIPHDEDPDDPREREGAHDRGRAEILRASRERMVLRADPVDRGFDAGVQELDDQHEHARADQERALHAAAAEPERDRSEHGGGKTFAAEGPFVGPR